MTYWKLMMWKQGVWMHLDLKSPKGRVVRHPMKRREVDVLYKFIQSWYRRGGITPPAIKERKRGKQNG